MQETFRTVLDWFATYDVWALAVLLFAAGLGVPSPASIGLLVSGALVRAGRMDPVLAVTFATVGSTLGQLASYWIGRKGLRGYFKKLKEGKAWRKAHEKYTARREMTVFLSRWLITPLALPINLIAGMEKQPWWAFTGLSLAGNLIWVLLYGAVGYSVGAAWRRLGEAAHWLGYVGVAAVVAGIVWWLIRKKAKAAAMAI